MAQAEMKPVVDTTSDDIGFKASVMTGFREKFHEAAVKATKEIFEGEILPAARAGSPVGGARDPHPGKNRDSIAVSFRDRVETSWISAWLYTQSGYGWLIEHGTSKLRALTKMKISKRKGRVAPSDRTPAKPYIYPAIIRFVSRIPERTRQIFEQGS